MKTPFLLLISLFAVTSVQAATTFTQWTFNAGNDNSGSTGTLTPFVGTGTASTIGGVTHTFAAGSATDTAPGSLGTPVHGNSGFNTTAYQAQNTGSGTAGVVFMTSTSGYEDVLFSFDLRASGTASRWAQLDYTLDGGTTWVNAFWNNNGGLSPHDSFYHFDVDLSSIPGADNNPLFGVRVVSIFSPTAFTQGTANAANTAYQYANAGSSNYAGTGTWRFDMVTFTGTDIAVVPEPSRALLAGLGILGLCLRRRKAI